MSRYSYQPDEYDLERSHELERQLNRDEEREPRWMHRPPRRTIRQPRYFSGLMFRPVRRQASPHRRAP